MTHSPDGASAGGLDLDELEKVARAATQFGPWSWRLGDTGKPDQWSLAPGILMAEGTDGTPGGDNFDRANAAHIETFSPATVLKMIAALRAISPSPGLGGSAGADIARTEPHSSVLTSTPCQSEWSAGHVLRQVSDFLADLANADLDESAADGGVTVGMVFQQQARTVYGPRIAAALSAPPTPQPTPPDEPDHLEAVARIAEPEAFAAYDRLMSEAENERFSNGEPMSEYARQATREDAPGLIKRALTKARAILALTTPAREGGEEQGGHPDPNPSARVAGVTATAASCDLEKVRTALAKLDDLINLPPPRWDIEPTDVRDYRHSIYPDFERCAQSILAALSSEAPSPKSEAKPSAGKEALEAPNQPASEGGER